VFSSTVTTTAVGVSAGVGSAFIADAPKNAPVVSTAAALRLAMIPFVMFFMSKV
jgi:hypothetical protein